MKKYTLAPTLNSRCRPLLCAAALIAAAFSMPGAHAGTLLWTGGDDWDSDSTNWISAEDSTNIQITFTSGSSVVFGQTGDTEGNLLLVLDAPLVENLLVVDGDWSFMRGTINSTGVTTIDTSHGVVFGKMINNTHDGGFIVNNGKVTFSNSSIATVGTISAPAAFVIGGASTTDTASSAALLVTKSTLTLNGAMSVGNYGTGTLALENAAVVTAQAISIGQYGNSSGSVSASASSGLTATTLTVGDAGKGTLDITGGARVSSATGVIGNTATGTGAVTVTGAGSAWNNTGDLTIGSAGTGSLTISGGTVNNSGALTIGSGGTLNIGASAKQDAAAAGVINTNSVSGSGTVQFNHTSASFYFTQDGTSAGTGIDLAGNLNVINTAGSTTLSGSTDFSGNVTVNGGTLNFANGLGNGQKTIEVNKDATISLAADNTGATSFADIRLNTGGTLALTGDQALGVLTLNGGTVTGSNTLRLQGNAGTAIDAQATATLANKIEMAGTNTAINVAPAATLTLTGEISAAPEGFSKTGTGTLTLTADNTYSGKTVVSAGTLQVGTGGTTGSLGTGDITNNAAIVFNRSDATAVSQTITGTGALTKDGAGTLTLSGVNTYTGITNIIKGTLVINGNQSAATGAITVGTGAALTGSGTIGGNVTVQTGGAIATGTSDSTLSTAGSTNVTLEAGAIHIVEIAAAGLNSLSVGGTLTILPGVELNINCDVTFEIGNTFSIATAGLIYGTYGNVNVTGAGAGAYRVDYTSNAITLVAIPEPSTYALLAGAVALLGAIARRRRKVS